MGFKSTTVGFAGGVKERRARGATDGTRDKTRGRTRRRGPPRRAMSRPSCGGENHPRCTRAARAARASPVAPRAPRPRSARNGDRREDARRGRRPATGHASRRARVWGVSCSRRGEGAGFTICHRRTLRACPKRSSRRHEYKWRSESIHPAGRAAEQFEVSAGYSSRSTRRKYDQNDATGPWDGYMPQEP